jgi:hypothetical protein
VFPTEIYIKSPASNIAFYKSNKIDKGYFDFVYAHKKPLSSFSTQSSYESINNCIVAHPEVRK